eukprot:1381094-Pleurochrysis_carterae.AAC.1
MDAPVGPPHSIGGEAGDQGRVRRRVSAHVHHVEHWLQPRYASTAFLSAAMKVSMCTNSARSPGSVMPPACTIALMSSSTWLWLSARRSCALFSDMRAHEMHRNNCSDCDEMSARRLASAMQKWVTEVCSTGKASSMNTMERGLSDEAQAPGASMPCSLCSRIIWHTVEAKRRDAMEPSSFNVTCSCCLARFQVGCHLLRGGTGSSMRMVVFAVLKMIGCMNRSASASYFNEKVVRISSGCLCEKPPSTIKLMRFSLVQWVS